MLRVKFYDKDHVSVKEFERVDHVNFYISENTACVFHYNDKGVQILTDIPATDLITIEEV